MLCLLVFGTLLLGARGASDVESITSQGYPAEVHNVTTEDGYILGVQRIPYGKKSGASTTPKKVVFFMHGVGLGSNSFTYMGSEHSIAYNLVDAGYDVWMGNARGNRYSRHHVSLDPDKDKFKFYDYSYLELALYDLPAMIDYILKTTKQTRLHYIGHSQGGAVFFALNSIKTEYQAKITSAHLLTGIGYQKMFPSEVVRVAATATDVAYNISLLTGAVEIKPSTEISQLLEETLVSTAVPLELIAGAGVKQSLHYIQNIRDKEFRQWSYGAEGNLAKYGSSSPPSYDLSKIKVNVTLHYSLGDKTQSEGDALAMVKAMQNARARKVAREDFDHMDYLVSKDMKTLITNYIIESLASL